MKKLYKDKNFCSICSSKNLKRVIELKKFPLTGIFIKKKIRKNFPYYFNQGLNICNKCGHLQLAKFVSPEILYNNIYANRTSESFLSDNAINFFKKFLFKVLKKKKLNGLLEIGCNDIKLIENLKNNFSYLYGIDPIWHKKKAPKGKKINVIGGYVENVNLKKVNKKIDVIVSTHNLEHINDPFDVLKKFIDNFGEDVTFFIEVPDADLMIKNLRFDQIFHQHYHYFNMNSLQNLTRRLGCKIISKSINYKFWGGSLMVAFKKNKNISKKISNNSKKINKNVISNYKRFKNRLNKLSHKLKNEKNLIGYGAGQMVPSFSYHLNDNLSFLEYIVDDNKNRAHKKYPNLAPKIKYFNKSLIKNKKVLITALDGVNGIGKKLNKLNVEFYNPLSNV
jgi:hypothetical protein